MLHDFFGHRSRYGNGTIVSVKIDGSSTVHHWLLTTNHIFFSGDTTREMRKEMEPETFRTTLMNSLRKTTFENEGSTCSLPAKDLLLDSDSPVFCFDKVRNCSMANSLCHIQNVHAQLWDILYSRLL